MNTGIFTGTSMFVVTAAWAGCTISDRRPSAKMGSTQRKFVDRIDFAPIGSPSLLTRGGFQVFLVGFDADGALPQGVAQFLSGKLLFEEAEMSVLPTVLLSSFRTPDQVCRKLQSRPDRRSMYSYLSRLRDKACWSEVLIRAVVG